MDKTNANKKSGKVLVQGAIQPDAIANSIAKHSTKTSIGAHDIFLGQVRSDVSGSSQVSSIEFSVYEEMAEEQFHTIREAAFKKFEIICMHIYHSIGTVNAGEICLFVFVSARHRQQAFEACRWIVEEIKAKVPVFGKEIYHDNTHSWKVNQ
ncbi:MAG: molybdenum cofactor biosynthesis protein MoaE [Bacteroidia bacterium]|jgi:molybdopterin synthase catalytic subunit|nr:molybdenum cofactor biosynthesis protein MoaE [Bacteroidia bacterium]